jgi:hypothetical protein
MAPDRTNYGRVVRDDPPERCVPGDTFPGLISPWLGTRATQESPLQIVRSLEAATTTGLAGGILRPQPEIDRLLSLQGNVIGEW